MMQCKRRDREGIVVVGCARSHSNGQRERVSHLKLSVRPSLRFGPPQQSAGIQAPGSPKSTITGRERGRIVVASSFTCILLQHLLSFPSSQYEVKLNSQIQSKWKRFQIPISSGM